MRICSLQFLHFAIFLSDTPTTRMSSLTTSMNLFFGLPPLLLLSNSSKNNILLPIYPSFCLYTCPYHINLASLTLSPICLTLAVPRINSFLILSVLVTPKENLNIFNSATARDLLLVSWSMVLSPKPYIMAGLTTVL